MRAAYALRISSGKIILNLQCRKICGFSGIAFSREGFTQKAPEGGCSSGRGGVQFYGVVLVSSKPMAT